MPADVTTYPYRAALRRFFDRGVTNLVILVLILCSVTLTIVELSGIERGRVSVERVSLAISSLFLLELGLRFAAEEPRPGRLRAYLRMWWLDWIAVLPALIVFLAAASSAFPLLRGLRTMRFLRMLRFARFLKALRFLRFYSAATRFLPDLVRRGRFYLAGTVFVLASAIIAGAVLLHLIEEPGGSYVGDDFIESVLFSVYSLLAGEPIKGPPDLTVAGQFAAIAVVLTGVVVVGVIVGLVSSLMFDYLQKGERKAMVKGAYWEGHVVLCGLGKVGFAVLQRLVRREHQVAIIDKQPNPRFAERASTFKLSEMLHADVLDPDVLNLVHVDKARAVIACTGSDSLNLEIALLARTHAPEVPVVAYIVDPRLQADIIDNIGRELRHPIRVADDPAGLVAMAVDSSGRDVFEVGAERKPFIYAEFPVGFGIQDATRSPRAFLEEYRVHVLMYRRIDGTTVWNPPLDLPVPNGAMLAVVGPDDLVMRLCEHCANPSKKRRRLPRLSRSGSGV